MKRGELVWNKEKTERLLDLALRFALGVLLFAGRIFGGYAPFAVGFIAAAGPGRGGLAALGGGVLGALTFLDFSHALRSLAAAVLLYTANNAFFETKLFQKKAFLPTAVAGLSLSVEFVYLTQSPAEEAANCLAAIACAVLTAVAARAVLSADRSLAEEKRELALLVLAVGILSSLSSLRFSGGFAPGRILAVLLVLLLAFDRGASSGLTAALLVGLVLDLGGEGGFLHTAVYGMCALAVSLEKKGRRTRAALLGCAPLILLALPLEAETGLILLYEGLCATLLFLLLPSRLFRGKRIAPREDLGSERQRSALQQRLSATAQAFRELYDSLERSPRATEENPATVFDRAAERVCRGCSLRTVCWERDYTKTYTALNDTTATLLAQGKGKGADFPSYFSDRCIRFPSFLAAVNAELSAYLLRRQYRARLAGTRTQAAEQYAELSELLAATAEQLGMAEAAAATLLTYRLGAALQPKEGENISGDCMTQFESEDGSLCLILSDGMGSGESARRESALAVRLLERFLRAGVETPGALKTLNSALTLRAESTEGFTTIDLARISLRDGTTEVYKYGAAPSYIKRGSRVRRITCSCLPAGLQGSGEKPEVTRVRLEGGAYLVMLTDGVADAMDDKWLIELLADWGDEDAQALANAILAESKKHGGGSDDAAVIALSLPREDWAREV